MNNKMKNQSNSELHQPEPEESASRRRAESHFCPDHCRPRYQPRSSTAAHWSPRSKSTSDSRPRTAHPQSQGYELPETTQPQTAPAMKQDSRWCAAFLEQATAHPVMWLGFAARETAWASWEAWWISVMENRGKLKWVLDGGEINQWSRGYLGGRKMKETGTEHWKWRRWRGI